MLIKKNLWNIVETSSHPERQNPALWVKEVKKDWIAVGIARQIILEGVSEQIAFNIIDLEDLKEMWDKLKSICNVIG